MIVYSLVIKYNTKHFEMFLCLFLLYLLLSLHFATYYKAACTHIGQLTDQLYIDNTIVHFSMLYKSTFNTTF